VQTRAILYRATRARPSLSLMMRAAFATGLCGAVILGISGIGSALAEPITDQTQQTRSVFQMPAHGLLQQRLTLPIITLFNNRRFAEAESALRQLIEEYPSWPVHHYNLGAALARQNKHDAALESLAKAISLGFANNAAMERDPDLNTLRTLPRFKELLADVTELSVRAKISAYPPLAPRPVERGLAVVDEANTVWVRPSNTLIAAFKFGNAPRTDQVQSGTDKLSRLLNRRYSGLPAICQRSLVCLPGAPRPRSGKRRPLSRQYALHDCFAGVIRFRPSISARHRRNPRRFSAGREKILALASLGHADSPDDFAFRIERCQDASRLYERQGASFRVRRSQH